MNSARWPLGLRSRYLAARAALRRLRSERRGSGRPAEPISSLRGPAGRRRAALLLAGLLLADLAWGALYVHRTSFVRDGARVFCLWDDAMISMRYAKHLAAGEGLVWNAGGERVQGISNLGVTLLMAALHLLPLDAFKASLPFQLLNLAALAGATALVWRIARVGLGADRALALGAALATALCAPLHIWSLQGSDAGLVCLWLLAAVALLAGAGARRWPAGLFPLLALGVWIRPDTTVFALVFLGVSPAFEGARARRLLAGGAWLAAAWGGLALFGQLYYGDPLPNTFYLKATGLPRDLVWTVGLRQLTAWLPGLAPVLACAAVATWRRRTDPLALVCALLLAAALLYHVAVGGDWKSDYITRFVVPALPLLMLLATAGCWDVSARLLREAPRARLAAFLAAAAALPLVLGPPPALREWFDPGAPTLFRQRNQRVFDYALYLRDQTLPSTTVAVHYGGVPPYFSERPAIDVLGRSDRHIARLAVDRFAPGHAKWDWAYVVRERRPDVFLATSRGLDRRADFRRDYLRVRAGPRLELYLRRDARHKLLDPDAVIEPLDAGPAG